MNKKLIIGSIGITFLGATAYSVLRNIMRGSRYGYDFVEKVEHIGTNSKLKLEEDGYYSITKCDDRPFKILQLTDMHIGGGYLSRHEDIQALSIMKKTIEQSKPDCIILTGDLVCSKAHITWSRNNLNSIKIISEMLEKMDIPYAVTFGNHDSEQKSTHSRRKLSEYLMGMKNCLMVFNEDNETITGCSNYLVKLRNKDGKLNSVLYMLDSNEYMKHEGKKCYDYIHDDQVDWYSKNVKRIEIEEYNAPSHLFFHIPLKEYDDAWKAVIDGKKNAKYYYGNMNEEVSCSPRDSKLFTTALELGSTKGIFCGHDHLNDFSISYKGIRLTYGQGIDCVLYAKNLSEHKGATLLKIENDGSFAIKGKKHRRFKK